MKRILYCLCVSCLLGSFPHYLSAQTGGNHVYHFLQLPTSARIHALGGTLITVADSDVTLATHNPAALSERMHRRASLQYQSLWGGAKNTTLQYGHYLRKWQLASHIGVQHVGYGTLQGTDEYGSLTNTFAANEYAVTAGIAKPLSPNLTLGVNARFINSTFETYTSTGISTDVAAMYNDTSRRFTAAIVVSQLGTQFKSYTDAREKLPLQVQIGVAKRLKYLPLRLSAIYQNAQQWDLRYNNPTAQSDVIFLGEAPKEDTKAQIFIDNFFRHMVFSGEFLFGKSENLCLRVGYNHQRRKELSVSNIRSLAGFSGGVGVKVSRFRVDYGFAVYSWAQTVHQFGISTYFGKKETNPVPPRTKRKKSS